MSSTAPETIRSADDVLDATLGLIDGVIGDQQLLAAGHSAGGYYAQAIASRRPQGRARLDLGRTARTAA